MSWKAIPGTGLPGRRNSTLRARWRREGDGMNPIIFLSRFSLHIPQDAKYWWYIYACKIAYVVKQLLAHTGLGLVSQSCPLSAALVLGKMQYFVYFLRALRTKNKLCLQYIGWNCGNATWRSKIGWSKIPLNVYIRLGWEQGGVGRRMVHGCLFGNIFGHYFSLLVLLPLECVGPERAPCSGEDTDLPGAGRGLGEGWDSPPLPLWPLPGGR